MNWCHTGTNQYATKKRERMANASKIAPERLDLFASLAGGSAVEKRRWKKFAKNDENHQIGRGQLWQIPEC
jgi:hypothetical protein